MFYEISITYFNYFFIYVFFKEEEPSREFADGVIELITVKVKTNYLQQYLDGLKT